MEGEPRWLYRRGSWLPWRGQTRFEVAVPLTQRRDLLPLACRAANGRSAKPNEKSLTPCKVLTNQTSLISRCILSKKQTKCAEQWLFSGCWVCKCMPSRYRMGFISWKNGSLPEPQAHLL